jgi:hypothetical protein
MSSTMQMGTEGASKKLAVVYQTTCHHISEHYDFHGKCYNLSYETTSLQGDYQYFRGTYCLHVQCRSDQGEKGARLYWQRGLWLVRKQEEEP